jgi:hypothetical protein
MVLQVLENKPSTTFWAALARALEKQTRDGAKSKVYLQSPEYHLTTFFFEDSTFLQQTLSSGYPKFLRLFHEFFSKIAVHTDTVYTQARQRSVCAFRFTLQLT